MLKNITISLARDNFPGLVRNLSSNAINKFERNISEKITARAGKIFTLFILNKNLNDIIKIMNSLEDLNVFIDGITEKVKHEIKKQGGGFLSALLAPLAASLVQPVISSVVKGTNGRGVRRAGGGYMDKKF